MQNWTRSLLVVSVCAAACGKIDDPSGEPAPDASAATDGPVADAGAPADAPVALDRSCTEVKARLGTATDGAYWIDPDLEGARYTPFEVFCGAMTTASPKEYLQLVQTSQPSDLPTSNYSTYATGAPHASWTCDCGVVTTLFSKVRIDPVTLVVEIGDRTFSVFATTTQLACLQSKPNCPGTTPYALAQACVTNYDASGRANIDLRGTRFHVAGTGVAMFTANGFTPAGSATIDDAREVVELTGGGDCGWFGAADGLQLAQDL
jgi:hypothetical protein